MMRRGALPQILEFSSGPRCRDNRDEENLNPFGAAYVRRGCTSGVGCTAAALAPRETSIGAGGTGTPVRHDSDSELYLTALAFAVARRRPDVLSNAVDPWWVATKMDGASAPDDFDEGYLTQTWLAVSEDPAATVGGRYWHHRRWLPPAKEVEDPVFQDQLSARLADMTGVSLF